MKFFILVMICGISSFCFGEERFNNERDKVLDEININLFRLNMNSKKMVDLLSQIKDSLDYFIPLESPEEIHAHPRTDG